MANPSQLATTLLEWSEVFMRGQMSGMVRYARKCGLSMSQAGALFRLGGSRTSKGVSDIGDHLGVTSAAASQLLDGLVQRGLIVRAEDPEDRRAKRIALTEEGRQVIDDGMKGRQQWFVSLAEAMTAEERATVVAGLRILIQVTGRSDMEESPGDLPASGGSKKR
jgi:DNA-binding MarR family transcriptional regulator